MTLSVSVQRWDVGMIGIIIKFQLFISDEYETFDWRGRIPRFSFNLAEHSIRVTARGRTVINSRETFFYDNIENILKILTFSLDCIKCPDTYAQ